MATVGYDTLPFAEQIAFFRSKRDVLTESYLDVWGAQHDASFMIAGANRADMLADFRAAIDKAISQGATLDDFRKDFDRIVDQYGWDYTGGRNWRTRVIYETNLRQSYNAGRWAQLQRLKRARPYWRYRHSDAVEHPRPIHQSWDGLIIHADDPWWLSHFPMNGWGCQCYVEALSERDLRKLGKRPDKAPPIEYETRIVGQRSPGGPRAVSVPKGIDPGFDYAPGSSLDGASSRGAPRIPPSMTRALERATQTALEKTMQLPAITAAQSAQEVLALDRARTVLSAGYASWQQGLLAAGQAESPSYMVGALDLELVQVMTAQSAAPATAAIVATQTQVLAAARAIDASVLAQLPSLLRAPRAVLLDSSSRMLIYVLDRGFATRIVVSVEYGGVSQELTPNTVSAAAVINAQDLRARLASGELRLLRGAI